MALGGWRLTTPLAFPCLCTVHRINSSASFPVAMNSVVAVESSTSIISRNLGLALVDKWYSNTILNALLVVGSAFLTGNAKPLFGKTNDFCRGGVNGCILCIKGSPRIFSSWINVFLGDASEDSMSPGNSPMFFACPELVIRSHSNSAYHDCSSLSY
ncbi:hypothetical protein MKX03_019558, partial [Papaver bracteatum]